MIIMNIRCVIRLMLGAWYIQFTWTMFSMFSREQPGLWSCITGSQVVLEVLVCSAAGADLRVAVAYSIGHVRLVSLASSGFMYAFLYTRPFPLSKARSIDVSIYLSQASDVK